MSKLTVHAQFLQARKYLIGRYVIPEMVLFSPDGLNKARYEKRELFVFDNAGLMSSYCGLPFGIDPCQSEDIRVTGPAPAYMVSTLSDAQLSDLIMEQVGLRELSNKPKGKLLATMERAVETYGRFE